MRTFEFYKSFIDELSRLGESAPSDISTKNATKFLTGMLLNKHGSQINWFVFEIQLTADKGIIFNSESFSVEFKNNGKIIQKLKQ